jgi:hypothetical protein
LRVAVCLGILVISLWVMALFVGEERVGEEVAA